MSTGRGLLDGNMFAYCMQAPTNQIDPDGATDFSLADLEMMSNRSLLSPYNLGSIAGGFRGNTAGIRSGYGVWKATQSYNECWISSPYNVGYSTPAHNQMSSSSVSTASIPLKAYETYDHLREHNFTPKRDYKGGRTYENDGRDGSAILPSAYAPFREFDIDPRVPGQRRNSERIVVGSGSGGGVWYTPDHYRHFLVMEVNFVK